MDLRESIQKNSGLINEMALQEMAKADTKGLDLTKSPEEIANAYIKKFETRIGKPFTARGVPGVAKSFEDEAIGQKVQNVLAAKFPKSAKSRGGVSKFTPEEIAAAKKFIDAVGDKATVALLNAAKKEL